MTDASPASSDVVGHRVLRILHAGSLTNLVRDELAPMLAVRHIQVVAERGFSVDLAEAIAGRRRTADLFLSADADLNHLLLRSEPDRRAHWFVVFARNAVALAYSAQSPIADEFARAAAHDVPWHEALLRPGLRLVRDDPYRDPLGYYAVLAMDLAERRFQLPGYRRAVLGDDANPRQVVPNPLAMLLAGKADATFIYRSGAATRGIPWVDLGPLIDLSEPALASTYAEACILTPSGGAIRGRPIACSATVVEPSRNSGAAVEAIELLLSPAGQDLVQRQNFLATPALVGGDAAAMPERLRPFLAGTYPTD